MKKIVLSVLLPALLLTSCGGPKYERFDTRFSGFFDVYTSIIGYASSKEDFDSCAAVMKDEIERLNALYDIYNDYEGVNNIKTINDNAGIAPVKADAAIIDMLLFSKKAYEDTGGKVNVAMGAVLKIWHDYREKGLEDPGVASLPPIEELKLANEKTDITDLVIDEAAGTVFLKEEGMSLDVGAIAKGYAAQRAMDAAAELGMESVLINMGGNVVTRGKPLDGKRDRWAVGIQDPQGNVAISELLDTIYTNDMAVVTSGNYQRFYIVDGKSYNHIIDPATLMPGERYAAVTILCDDSAVGEMLSTGLFLMDIEEGKAMLEKYSAEAMWTHHDDSMEATDGYTAISKVLGGAGS